jgi:hypothetical protein
MLSATAISSPAAPPDLARKRVLMVTPHFPPDTMAGTHRVRLLAPYLPEFGWDPVVLTVDPLRYEQPIDPDLAALVPRDLRVLRCRAWSPGWTRRIGIGDLGLRAFVPAWRLAASIMRRERFDALYITTYPIYTAALGPLLKRRFGVPFVVDLQDPWVGAWGQIVGGGPGGAADFKSRISRRLAMAIEPSVFKAADAITAVSTRTIEDVLARVPEARGKRGVEIPIGGDARDFAETARSARRQQHFDPRDGLVHLCAVGTLLPLGVEVVRVLFAALSQLRWRSPESASRVRLHFFGTSNERNAGAVARVLGLAADAGVADLVSEHPARIDYLDAVRVQLDASALLLLGSTEQHYTASKLYPALLAERPLLALYHEASSVTRILRQYTRPPTVRAIAFDGATPVASRTGDVADALRALADGAEYRAGDVDPAAVADYSARTLAGRLAALLSQVA